MTDLNRIGYMGKILRVDLSEQKISTDSLDEATVKKWVGGVGLGTKYLYDEVPPDVRWSDPENRLIWTTGPLAGSGVDGAATINIMAKGPMTHTAGSSHRMSRNIRTGKSQDITGRGTERPPRRLEQRHLLQHWQPRLSGSHRLF